MLVISLTENDLHRANEAEELGDMIELRLDTIKDPSQLPSFTKPLILTARSEAHGGYFSGTDEEKSALYASLSHLRPAFIDVEIGCRAALHGVPKIISYHNFETMPDDLDALYEMMGEGEIYKIVAKATTVEEMIRLLAFTKRRNNVAGMCLGEYGPASRAIGPIVGSRLTYAPLPNAETTAPGQIDAKTLLDIYNYRKLTQDSKIYALLGNPVDHSPSYITHNAVLQTDLYLRLRLDEADLEPFFRLRRQLPFAGFSITLPYKEKVALFADEIDEPAKKSGAINTFYQKGDRWHATNTDGVGALNAIEEKLAVHGKNVVILGAGGAARAIAYEAKKRGAKVFIANRTHERAQTLADELGVIALRDHGACDILINATTVGMPPNTEALPIDPAHLDGVQLVFDAIARHTRLLKEAEARGIQTVSGFAMFAHQAVVQFTHWFTGKFSATDFLSALPRDAE